MSARTTDRGAHEETPFSKPRSTRKGNSSRKGRGWEAQLRVWHDAYRARGDAWVVQTAAKIKRIGGADGSSRFEAQYASGGPPDFTGVARGVAVAFDAKDCAAARWALSQVADHQAKHLDDVVRAGGFAFIALRLGPDVSPRCWVVSWERLAPRWRRGGTIGIPELDEGLGLSMHDDGWFRAVQAFADIAVMARRVGVR